MLLDQIPHHVYKDSIMLFHYDLQIIVILLPILIFSLVFHEFAHAYVAYKLGDNTAKNLGRLTLNPLPHLDLFGGLMVLLVGFGWAKPVPININNLKNTHSDMIKIAAAGPAANILLALLGGLLVQSTSSNYVEGAFFIFTQINIALAIFNLIPVAPLDGSQILSGILINHKPHWVYNLRVHGPKVLFAAVLIGFSTNFSPIWWLIGPTVKYLTLLFVGR